MRSIETEDQKESKFQFVILSNQQYDLPLKTNKWHVANVLAKKKYKVLFVDPPLRYKAFKNLSIRCIVDILRGNITKNINNVYIYRPVNFLNFWPFSIINTLKQSNSINGLINEEDKKNYIVLWIYHFDYPDLEKLVGKLKYDVLIYDVVDEYTAFPEYSHGKIVLPKFLHLFKLIDTRLKILLNQGGKTGVEWVIYREKWLSQKANLIFASAPGLVEKFKKWGYDAYYLPNAADATKFDISKDSVKIPDDIKDIPHPRIGFTGAIDSYKADIDLMYECAKKYPNIHFILIGPKNLSDPNKHVELLTSLNNVHFLGTKKWEDTPSYFVNFDAYYIPYNLNKYTVIGCFPVKYFESLAAGLPTIVTNLPAYKNYDVDGYVSKDSAEFILNISKALKENNAERVKRRKKVAYENTWENKVNNQIKLINSFIKN